MWTYSSQAMSSMTTGSGQGVRLSEHLLMRTVSSVNVLTARVIIIVSKDHASIAHMLGRLPMSSRADTEGLKE